MSGFHNLWLDYQYTIYGHNKCIKDNMDYKVDSTKTKHS
jgi:hypothetical protein